MPRRPGRFCARARVCESLHYFLISFYVEPCRQLAKAAYAPPIAAKTNLKIAFLITMLR